LREDNMFYRVWSLGSEKV